MSATGVFVDRTAELARIADLLDRAQQGRAGGLFLLGEPGVGKSRLLHEGTRLAIERGVRVALASCLPLTTPLPLDPLTQLLRSIGESVGVTVNGPSAERFWTIIERLEQTSVLGPVLLCLDDVQWSDAATIDLVHYCLARLSDLPLVWLLAARSSRSQSRLVHRLGRGGLLERVDLGTLSASDTQQLAESLLGRSRVSEQVVELVYRRTGGNAFLCVELLRSLIQANGEQGAEADPAGGVEALVPASVRDAIEDRADHLPPTAREALDWAAILPAAFGFEELEAVAGPAASTAPEELAEVGFLVTGNDGRWSFAHSLIRDAVYQRLPKAERTRRHAVVADSLLDGPLVRLAPQLEHAGRWKAAAVAYLALADSALTSGLGEDGAQLYERSEELAAKDGDELLRRRASAGRVLARVHIGQIEDAHRAAAELRSELRANAGPEERLSFLSRFATALMIVHGVFDVEGARDALEEAEPLIEQAHGGALADVLATRAWVLLQTGEATRALADAELAAELIEAEGDPALKVRVLNALGLAVGITRSPVEGSAILEQAAARAQEAGLSAEAGRAFLSLSILAADAGDASEQEAQIRKGLAIEGLPASFAALLTSDLGDLEANLGRLDTALAHQLTALRLVLRTGPQTRSRVACALAFVHVWRGELAAARRVLQAYELRPGSATDSRVTELWGLLDEEDGSAAKALSHYLSGRGLDGPAKARCELGVVRTSVALGDVGRARVAAANLDGLAGHWPDSEWTREEARGWLAVAEGRTAEAAAAFLGAASQSPRAFDVARLRFEAARLADQRERVNAAIDAFDRMGAIHAGARARAAARGLGMRPSRRRPPAGALSAREHEIVQLVAAGQTNSEIAAALYLSRRTVERHVSNILAKLGYRSRVQIASDAAAGRLPGAANDAEALVSD